MAGRAAGAHFGRMKHNPLAMPTKAKAPPPANFRPLSPKMRAAIRLTVEEGLTGEEAAKRAGVSPSGYWLRNRTPPAIEYRKQLIEAIEGDLDKIKAVARVAAYRHAIKVITSTDESITEAQRAKYVELLAREDAKNSAPAVQVNVNSTGYEFPKRGQRVVDITPDDAPQDNLSNVETVQGIDIQAQSGEG